MANGSRSGLHVPDECYDSCLFNPPWFPSPFVDNAGKWHIRPACRQRIVECHIRPRFATEHALTVQAWPSITSDMPRASLPVDIKDRFSTLKHFNVASQVEMLLRVNVFSAILDGRKVKIDDALPTAFSSTFGWVLIGPIPAAATCPSTLRTVTCPGQYIIPHHTVCTQSNGDLIIRVVFNVP